jgi:hypothetical protein
MKLDASVTLLWYVTISLDVILVVLLMRRRAIFSLPFFSLFVLISAVRSLLLWAVYRWIGFTSLPSQYAAWSTQAVLLMGRAAVCAELCWYVLRRNSGLWSVARSVLVAIAVAIAAYAVVDSFRSAFSLYYLFVAAERGLELAIGVVLISLLLVTARYKIPFQRTPFLLVAGLCFYSLVQTLNNAAFYYGLAKYFPWWNSFRMVAFQLTLLVWIGAFATRDFDSDDKPVPVIPRSYAKHVEEVSQKLRSLDKDLEEIVRK